MPRQTGIIKLEGSIGDRTYYKMNNIYYWRKKGGYAAPSIRKSIAYTRAMENAMEFGRASKAGKLFRNAFNEQVRFCTDNKLVSRVTQLMTKVVKADKTNPRGKRTLTNGNLNIFKGFRFNKNISLSDVLPCNYTLSVNASSGIAQVSLPDFIPSSSISAPSGVTHIRFVLSFAIIDFDHSIFSGNSTCSELVEIDKEALIPIDLQIPLNSPFSGILFIVFGMECLQIVNGKEYRMSAKHNASEIRTVMYYPSQQKVNRFRPGRIRRKHSISNTPVFQRKTAKINKQIYSKLPLANILFSNEITRDIYPLETKYAVLVLSG